MWLVRFIETGRHVAFVDREKYREWLEQNGLFERRLLIYRDRAGDWWDAVGSCVFVDVLDHQFFERSDDVQAN